VFLVQDSGKGTSVIVTIDLTPCSKTHFISLEVVGIPHPANLLSINHEKLVGFFVTLPCIFRQKFPGLLIIRETDSMYIYTSNNDSKIIKKEIKKGELLID
jgi:hypothetical protein